jgi:hypothetical protein
MMTYTGMMQSYSNDLYTDRVRSLSDAAYSDKKDGCQKAECKNSSQQKSLYKANHTG